MLLPILAMICGLGLLVWSADRFVDGSAASARHLGVPPLLIGMIILGFGTSAPEIVVAIFAAIQGNPGIALGNAYGSNISNIALILGVTALVVPIAVHSQVLRRELPILLGVTGLAAWQVSDGQVDRTEAWTLLAVFALFMAWSVWQGLRQKDDALEPQVQDELKDHAMPIKTAMLWLIVGLILLIISSRILVWGAVEVARSLGISDLIIGLTVIAVGTSLPELASSIIAVRKNEHDIALGNVLGSNLFNTLAVVGLAGVIRPMDVGREVFERDMLVMGALTVALVLMSFGFRRQGRINRIEGAALVTAFVAYIGWLVAGVVAPPS